MGGSYSAQSADLHSLWSLYTHRYLFRQPGTLKIAEQGFIYWENARGKVSLQQFRDNILVASTYPDSPETALVHKVRGIPQQAWGLRVLCNCCTSDSDVCRFKCHNTYTQAVGFCLVRGRNGRGSAYTHPSTLDSLWGLKVGPTLLSCNLSYHSYLPCLLIGVLSNSPRWCQTWAGELLIVSAWMQVAVLSGYPLRAVLRATHSAVVRGLSTGPQDFNSTVRFMYYIAPHLPLPHCCAVSRCAVSQCLQWLKKHAIWRGPDCSSWSLPTGLRPGAVSGAWCSDFPSLQEHVQLLVCPSALSPSNAATE